MRPAGDLDRRAMALLVVLCAIWGVQQVSIKVASAGISPLFQAGLRSLGAAVLLALWSRWRGIRLGERDGSFRAGAFIAFCFAAEFACIYAGLAYTTASRGVIFLYTAPFFVALGAVTLLPNESLGRPQWLGMGLAFAGILALFGENLGQGGGETWKGDLLLWAAALFWAAVTLTIKAGRLARLPAEKTLFYQLAGSALLLPGCALVMGEPGIIALTPGVIGAMVFQIVAVAFASYLAWFWLIRHYPATRLSSFSFLTPVFGVLAGGGLLGERLTPAVWLALALVALGIWLANRPARAT